MSFGKTNKVGSFILVRYDRIWALCDKTGKKRSYLSVAMGHSSRYLLDARKQNTNISGEALNILALELQTTPEYLTGETDDPGAKNPAFERDAGEGETASEQLSLDDQLVVHLTQLTPDEREKVIAYTKGLLAARQRAEG